MMPPEVMVTIGMMSVITTMTFDDVINELWSIQKDQMP